MRVVDDKVKCEICGNCYGAISSTHLKIHGIKTISEYKLLYPESKIVSDLVSKKLADNARNNKNIGFKKGCVHKSKVAWNKGLTVDDPRVKSYVDKMIGKKMSDEQKKKLSDVKTKRVKYIICQSCGGPKSKTISKLCRPCSTVNRFLIFGNPMSGRKLSDAHKSRLLESKKNQINKINKPEKLVLGIFEKFDLKYVGDRSKWVTFKNGRHKNPDFIFDNMKICIEVFGDYWHKNEDPNDLISLYKEIGWDCLVIWEGEIIKKSSSSIFERVTNFVNSLNRKDDDFLKFKSNFSRLDLIDQ